MPDSRRGNIQLETRTSCNTRKEGNTQSTEQWGMLKGYGSQLEKLPGLKPETI